MRDKDSEEFSITSLQRVCHLITDGKHGDCQNEEDSGYFFLSAKDVRNGKLNYDNARQITEADFLQTHKRTQLAPLDILISNSGTIGRMAIATEQEKTFKTTFQKSVAILKPNKAVVYPHWLFYYLLYSQDKLINAAGGTAQKNLLLRDLREFTVVLPTLPIQRKIAAILSAYDDLIENNARRIAILEEMAQMLYHEWFVRFRFPGHADVRRVESELGLVPDEWEVSPIGEIALVNAASIKESTAPEFIGYIDISSVSTGSIDRIESLPFAEAPSRARRKVRHGDIIWSSVRPNRRSYSLILEPPSDLIVSTGFAVISAQKVPYTYLYQALTTDEFVGYLTNRATGAAYPAVNSGDFKGALILLPPPALLAQFHDIAVDFFGLKHDLLQKNENLRQTRDLLLPRLVSGELNVSNLDIALPPPD